MLRIQSECLPLQRRVLHDTNTDNKHSEVYIEHRSGAKWGIIHIMKRKSTPRPSIIQRKCLCQGRASQRHLCGVCIIEQLLATNTTRQLFHINLHKATTRLREHLFAARPAGTTAGWPIHASWHAFRRGAASDALRGGESIGSNLAAPGWKSSAILR